MIKPLHLASVIKVMPGQRFQIGGLIRVTATAIFFVNVFACFSIPAVAGAETDAEGQLTAGVEADQSEAYSPPVRNGALTNLYWGDTHLHTKNSPDAYMLGNVTLAPEDAFRFARGEERLASNGMRVKLLRPLDFLVVSDHAEYLGIYGRLEAGDPELDTWEVGRRWGKYLREGMLDKIVHEFEHGLSAQDPSYYSPKSIQKSIWEEVAQTADRFNEPGKFTAFIGYEWTSMPAGDNLHRVVVFRDGADRAAKIIPFSSQDSKDPEALWQALDLYERQTAGKVLAIPHNSNLSNGRMFAPTMSNGEPFTSDYARSRSRWEPVVEATQLKGDSESHPVLSPTDEFADFETWDRGNISMSQPKEDRMLQYEYVRSALKLGLKHEEKLGVNPFKFGLIGSTDSHTAFSTTAEDNFFGKYLESEPSPDRVIQHMGKQPRMQEGWELGASGLAAVWAVENTREALFDALERREVYGTTGSRIKVRFFGGFDYQPEDVLHPDYVRIGYQKGVPMGGDLLRPSGDQPSVFMVAAAKDPDGANLDRIQIVKGWLDKSGALHESIHDVALSDGRVVNPGTGKAPPVGSTVDIPRATYTNSIGAPELTAVWKDPDFNPDERAFYYVRVIEIPKPRWTAYDARFFHRTMPDNVPMTIQDRAYTSPIWYNP